MILFSKIANKVSASSRAAGNPTLTKWEKYESRNLQIVNSEVEKEMKKALKKGEFPQTPSKVDPNILTARDMVMGDSFGAISGKGAGDETHDLFSRVSSKGKLTVNFPEWITDPGAVLAALNRPTARVSKTMGKDSKMTPRKIVLAFSDDETAPDTIDVLIAKALYGDAIKTPERVTVAHLQERVEDAKSAYIFKLYQSLKLMSDELITASSNRVSVDSDKKATKKARKEHNQRSMIAGFIRSLKEDEDASSFDPFDQSGFDLSQTARAAAEMD
jgi:hypothetical protein